MTDLEVSLFFQSQKFWSLPRLFKIFKIFIVFSVLDEDGVKVKSQVKVEVKTLHFPSYSKMAISFM